MGEVTLKIGADLRGALDGTEKLNKSVAELNKDTQAYNQRATAGFNQTAVAADKAGKEIGNIGVTSQKVGNTFKSMATTMASAFTVGAIINFSKQAVAAYQTQIRSEAKLKDALKGREGTVKALITQSIELQKTTLFGDEDIVAAQAMLAINIKDEKQLKQLTQATLDLASAKGMDLTSAAQAVNLATTGQGRALKSLGIELDLTGTKTQNVTKVMAALNETVGGKAQAALSEEERALRAMQVAVDETTEAWGKFVLTLSSKALGTSTEAETFSTMATALAAMTRSVADFKVDGFRDFLDLVTDIVFPLKGLISIWDSLRGSIGEMAKEQAEMEGAAAAIEADKLEIERLAAAYEKLGIPAIEAMSKATLAVKLSLIEAREATDEGSASYKLYTAQINAITEAEKEVVKVIEKKIDVEKMSTGELINLRKSLADKYGDLILTGVKEEDEANKAKLELINKEIKYREDANKIIIEKQKQFFDDQDKLVKEWQDANDTDAKIATDRAEELAKDLQTAFDDNPMFSDENGAQAKAYDDAQKLAADNIAEFEKIQKEAWEAMQKFAEDHPMWASLGLENEDQLNQIKDFSKELYTLLNTIIDQQVEASNKLVDDYNQRIDEQEQLVNRELEMKKEGLANNYDIEKANLTQMQKQRDAAVKDQQKNIQIQRNLAMIESGIALTTSIANIMKGFSKIPIIGWALGLAAVAAMITGFVLANKKAKDAIQMEEGGQAHGLLKGRRHSQGGIPIEAEEGEWFINRNSSAKYSPLLDAINRDDQKGMKLFFDRKFISKMPQQNLQFNIDSSKKLGEIVRELKKGKADVQYGPGYIIERIGGYTKKINLN